MKASQYRALTKPLRERPAAVRVLVAANKALTSLFYLLYPMLLIGLAAGGLASTGFTQPMLAPAVVVPGVAFVAVSAFRRLLNAKRPYEALDIDPLIPKATRGKSFPSRHVFCAFAIASCWFICLKPVGIALYVVAAAVAVIRVVGGVHFPRDVIAGAVVGVVFVLGGFFLWALAFWPDLA